MLKIAASLVAAAALIVSLPLTAQSLPGIANAKRVAAGAYKIDTNHTQVFWTVNHMGLTPLTGAFSASGGTLQIDLTKPASSKVSVTFDMTGMSTTLPAFTHHLSSTDFFDVDKFPTAAFSSTAVAVSGNHARINGNLTIKGVTKPVVLDAILFGAGTNPMTKKLNLGFTATTKVRRSDFGLGYALPVVGDQIDLRITAAFERDE